MKILLPFIIFLLFGSTVSAQQQGPTIVFEKRHGKMMRIKKYKLVEVVSEKSFTIPVFTHDELVFFQLEHRMTSYNKNEMIRLISNFLKRKRKYFDFDKLKEFFVECYFDKSTFELKEISYHLTPGSISKYSILRNLTEEIKNKGNLSIKKDFKDKINVYRTDIDKFAPKYFRVSFSIRDSDLKPYL